MIFHNRYEAIKYYEKKLVELETSWQDFLVHQEKIKSNKLREVSSKMKEINDSIAWNRAELRRETLANTKQIMEE